MDCPATFADPGEFPRDTAAPLLMKWAYSSALQAAGCPLPNVEMAESESLGHPGGMQDISRWLSAAIPPDRSPSHSFKNPGRGSGHIGSRWPRSPAPLPGCQKGRGDTRSRWCRFAQPPANSPHPSGVKRERTPVSITSWTEFPPTAVRGSQGRGFIDEEPYIPRFPTPCRAGRRHRHDAT